MILLTQHKGEMLRGLFIFLFLAPTLCYAESPLTNFKEADSYYLTDSKIKSAEEFIKKVGKQQLVDFADSLLNDESIGKCSFLISEKLEAEYGDKIRAYSTTDIDALRVLNRIDDISYLPLSNSRVTKEQHIENAALQKPKRFKVLQLRKDEAAKEALEKYIKMRQRGQCPSDAYRAIYAQLKKQKDEVSNNYLMKLNHYGFIDGIIDDKQFARLEKMRIVEVQNWKLTVKNYLKKLAEVRTQFPLPDEPVYDSFVTGDYEHEKRSRRVRLYERYSMVQMAMMGELVQKLRRRLTSTRIEIRLWQEDGEIMEEIELSPMDRFYFILQQLRKEMAILSNSQMFQGDAPQYDDIITAAFEINYIPESEMNELKDLNEIWDPSETRWQKTAKWLKVFGSASAVLLPPPYGFVAVLGLMGLEQSTRNELPGDSDYNIFGY